MMSKKDFARFKSADAKLLALQRRKALLDEKAVELDDDQAVHGVQPAGIMERAEQDFSRQVWVQVHKACTTCCEPCTFGKILC